MVEPEYDVAVIGGGLVGAMAAIMFQKRGLRCVVLEGRPAGREQKVLVGEALTEGSSVFLRHELGLTDWLTQNAFRKFGFDFLTLPKPGHHAGDAGNAGQGDARPPAQALEDCHELLFSLVPLGMTPAHKKLIPTYHVERTRMNRHVGEVARSLGAAWLDGAQVKEVKLERGRHEVQYRKTRADGAAATTVPGEAEALVDGEADSDSQVETVSARYVLDCSGRRTVLARQLGTWKPLPRERLNTASVWNRFRGVNADPEVWRTFRGIDRRKHTIHMTGPGFWIWWIHQDDNLTSIGISWDCDQHQPDVKAPDRGFREMISKFPPILALIEGAEALEPYQYYAHLGYRADYWVHPDGYALIGDAAWFTDALYSTGIETACRQLANLAPLVEQAARGTKAHGDRATDTDVNAEALCRTLNEEYHYASESVIAINQFKYRHGWANPYVVAQTALYELGDITELYHLQSKEQWTPELRGMYYHLPWYNAGRLERLTRFLDESRAQKDRDTEPGAPLMRKALLPDPFIYYLTWPLWNVQALLPFFFHIIRGWAYWERQAQRRRRWPDVLAWMASEHELDALRGRGVRPLDKKPARALLPARAASDLASPGQ